MLSVLCSGTLIADSKSRTAATGKAYATAMLRVPVEDGEPVFASLIAFEPSAVDALLALGKGDSVAVAGRGKLTNWTAPNGEQRHGISIVADRVLTAYQVGKMRKAALAEEV